MTHPPYGYQCSDPECCMLFDADEAFMADAATIGVRCPHCHAGDPYEVTIEPEVD